VFELADSLLVLTLRSDILKQERQMRRDRIVAAHRVARLEDVMEAEQHKRAEQTGADSQRNIPAGQH
jgi:hypothetical protein